MLENQSQCEELPGLAFFPSRCPKQIWNEPLILKELRVFSLVRGFSHRGGLGDDRMFSRIL